jgi:hypothetical protein
MRYYFHIQDGTTTLDSVGSEHADQKSAREEALLTVADSLRDDHAEYLWDGNPWRLWVTDQPDGMGKTLFALNFTAASAG